MTSQLNVDTIVDKAGSGGTNVKIGNTSTYVSDGGAVSQNTVQGLAKAWGNFNQATVRDSFNISSATDQATGNYLYLINNDMSNTDYSVVTNGARNEDAVTGVRDTEITAAQFAIVTHSYSGSDVDSDSLFFGVLGDLA
jgi:predicted transcriptional regulator YdeE